MILISIYLIIIKKGIKTERISGSTRYTIDFVVANVGKIYLIGNGISKEQEKILNEKGVKIVEINKTTPYDINVAMLNRFKKEYTNIVLVNNPIDAVSINCFANKNKSLFIYAGTNLTNKQKAIINNHEIGTIYYSGGGKIKGPLKEAISVIENKGFNAELKLDLNTSKVVFYIPHQDDESSYFYKQY